MAAFEPPPTYAEVVLIDERTNKGRFNPIWLKWFVDLAALLPGAGAGLGTVTSVGASFTGGLVSVGGSPVTTSGTLALTVAGTSGGVPYFSSGTTWASSGALTNHGVVLGGGAGAAPVTIAVGANNTFLKGSTGANPAFAAITLASADFVNQGTTTTLLHGNAAGNPSFGAVNLANDVSGNLALGSLPTAGINATITTAPITGGGTTGSMTFTNGVLTAQTPAT